MKEPAPEPEMLTVPEVAIALRLSQATIYRLLQSGRLRAVRVGGSWRVARESIDLVRALAGVTSNTRCAPAVTLTRSRQRR